MSPDSLTSPRITLYPQVWGLSRPSHRSSGHRANLQSTTAQSDRYSPQEAFPGKKPTSHIRTQEEKAAPQSSSCETLKSHKTTPTVAVCTEPRTEHNTRGKPALSAETRSRNKHPTKNQRGRWRAERDRERWAPPASGYGPCQGGLALRRRRGSMAARAQGEQGTLGERKCEKRS